MGKKSEKEASTHTETAAGTNDGICNYSGIDRNMFPDMGAQNNPYSFYGDKAVANDMREAAEDEISGNAPKFRLKTEAESVPSETAYTYEPVDPHMIPQAENGNGRDIVGKVTNGVEKGIGKGVDIAVAAIIGGVLLAADVIVLAVKNRCPYCHKMLRIGLIDGEEYCPYCGGEIR